MGEAKRRKHAGITDTTDATDTTGRMRELRVVLDFIWPGAQAEIARQAQAGDPRAQRCVRAAKLLANEMQHQRVKCQGCDVPMPTMESLGAVAVTPQAPARIRPELAELVVMAFCLACTADPERVRQVARAHVAKLARMIDQAEVAAFDEISTLDAPREGADTLLCLEIGDRAQLTQSRAREAAKALAEAIIKVPQALVSIVVRGFAEDPRELWEIPEVKRYINQFADALAAHGAHMSDVNLTPDSKAILNISLGLWHVQSYDRQTGKLEYTELGR